MAVQQLGFWGLAVEAGDLLAGGLEVGHRSADREVHVAAAGLDLDALDHARELLAGEGPEPVETAMYVVWWCDRMGQRVAYPPNVAGWPHNESWIDASHMAARVQTGRDAGWFVMSDEMDGSPVGAELARIDSPDRLAEALLRQFGLVEWSDATFQAVRRAADADGWTAHDQAFAAAFYSPEVTFS